MKMENIKNFIVCGSGRCGTMTLKKLFEANGVNATHELEPVLPWRFNQELCDQKTKMFLESDNFCDVALWHLNYLEEYLEILPELKIIILKRDKKDTIISFLNKIEGKNHFVNHDGKRWEKDEKWDRCFPKYKAMSKSKAIGQYWNDYYSKAEQLRAKFPDNIIISNIEDFETDQYRILRFAGLSRTIKNERFNAS